ncbi:MAG: LPS export ABC transporter periplasmic protein LptC [Gammaproteobacteria bacterium]
MDGRNWFQIILLLVAAVASGVLLLRNTGEIPEKTSAARLGIGYYMTDAELIVTGQDGRARYRVQTDSALQNKRTGMIDLDKVYVEYEPASSIPWDLRADSGYIPPDRNVIELTGGVVVRTKDDENAPVTIRTEFLELDTDTYIAETEHEVAIDYATNTVFATGMRAFFKEDKLQLLAHVYGTFNPQPMD